MIDSVFYPEEGNWRFKPIAAYPLFVLYFDLFCLRTSKSLSMGEFDKCHICVGIFIDLELILGLICII